MSVLIKGIEMPKSCMNCMFCGFAGADCELDLCQITGNAQKHIPNSKMPDCPLIEVPKWIPVAERWPEQFKPVLVYYNRNGCSGMGVAEYYHDGDTKVWRGCGFIPTHWMPLPEPPKDGESI